MNPLSWLLLPVVAAGHLGLCSCLYNQTHATGFPRWVRKFVERIIILAVLSGFGWFVFRRTQGYVPSLEFATIEPVYTGYEWGCMLLISGLAIRWLVRKCAPDPIGCQTVRAERHRLDSKNDPELLSGWDAVLLGYFPGNQSLQIQVEQKEIQIEKLPGEMDGFLISQISDLHFTGKIGPSFYEKVVALSNQSQPDLVCLTGDIVDADACLDWVEPILGKLQARLGVYYILGNHDRRVDSAKLHERLQAAGLRYAAPRWQAIRDGDSTVWIAGNELPWYQGAENLAKVPESGMPSVSVLLSHSPDQFGFAVKRHVDLVLAGHVHGGQIRLPWIGPIVAPSRWGVKYASRAFFRQRKTLMHVTRGVAGDDIIRVNCPPELSLIRLVSGQNNESSG